MQVRTPQQMNFTFQTRWKEELVCSCPLGKVVLEMPMGVASVYILTELAWQSSAPAWARPHWRTLYTQLLAWCIEYEFPLYVDNTASVFAG